MYTRVAHVKYGQPARVRGKALPMHNVCVLDMPTPWVGGTDAGDCALPSYLIHYSSFPRCPSPQPGYCWEELEKPWGPRTTVVSSQLLREVAPVATQEQDRSGQGLGKHPGPVTWLGNCRGSWHLRGSWKRVFLQLWTNSYWMRLSMFNCQLGNTVYVRCY